VTLSERISSGDISQEVVEAVYDSVAQAVFAANFHDEEARDVILEKWHEWPEEQRKARRQANAAITALLRALGE